MSAEAFSEIKEQVSDNSVHTECFLGTTEIWVMLCSCRDKHYQSVFLFLVDINQGVS